MNSSWTLTIIVLLQCMYILQQEWPDHHRERWRFLRLRHNPDPARWPDCRCSIHRGASFYPSSTTVHLIITVATNITTKNRTEKIMYKTRKYRMKMKLWCWKVTILWIDGYKGTKTPWCQAVVGTVLVDIDTMAVDGEYFRINVHLPQQFTVVAPQGDNFTSTRSLCVL